jgi:hypothetical protein
MSDYTNLKIELLSVGDTGWGPTTNNNFRYALEQAIIGSADVTFASADVTLTLTNSNLTFKFHHHVELMMLSLSGTVKSEVIMEAL